MSYCHKLISLVNQIIVFMKMYLTKSLESLCWVPKQSLCIVEVHQHYIFPLLSFLPLLDNGFHFFRVFFLSPTISTSGQWCLMPSLSRWPLPPPFETCHETCHETFWLFFHQEQNCITVLSSWYLCPKATQPFTGAVSFIGQRVHLSLSCWIHSPSLLTVYPFAILHPLRWSLNRKTAELTGL